MPRGVYPHKKGFSNVTGKHWKLTEENKKNISLAKKGKPCYWLKGKVGNNKGKRWLLGKKAHNWKGGVTKNKAYVNWQKNKRNRLKDATCKKLGSHTFGEWELLKKQYGYTCPCCKKIEPEIKLTEDHIIPLSKGGADLIENIQPLCLRCNISKHNKIIPRYDR